MIEVNADTSTGMGAIGRMQVVVRCERVFISICARRNGRAFASLTARGGGLPVGVTGTRHHRGSCFLRNTPSVKSEGASVARWEPEINLPEREKRSNRRRDVQPIGITRTRLFLINMSRDGCL